MIVQVCKAKLFNDYEHKKKDFSNRDDNLQALNKMPFQVKKSIKTMKSNLMRLQLRCIIINMPKTIIVIPRIQSTLKNKKINVWYHSWMVDKE